MSSPKIRILPQIGSLIISIYDYAKRGDTLAKHVHDETTEHIVEFQRGRFTLGVEQPDGSVIETEHDAAADTGWLVDTFAGYPHWIRAETDNARSIHTQKNMIVKELKVAA